MSEGRKLDAGKPRFDLIPPAAEAAIVDVLTLGAEKYSPENWRSVPEPERRYFAALRRHLSAWQRGERLDPDDGKSHLAHAGCCLLFLLDLDLGGEPPAWGREG